MLNTTDQLLKLVEDGLRLGCLTVGRQVEALTLVCFTEKSERNGQMMYHQWPYELIPFDVREAFKNKKRGDKVGRFKIVGVYDVWHTTDDSQDIA